MSLKSNIKSLLYPNTCFICLSELTVSESNNVCSPCINSLNKVREEQNFHYALHYLKDNYYRAMLAFQFDSFSQAFLHRLKYQHGKNLGIFMGELMGNNYLELIKEAQIDAIIPCPLHRQKLFEREFNQAEQLAIGIANITKIPIRSDILIRTKYTKTQTKLNKEQRQKNLDNVFEFKNDKSLKRVIIVDDVITTGSTLNKIAQAIHAVRPDIECVAMAFACPI